MESSSKWQGVRGRMPLTAPFVRRHLRSLLLVCACMVFLALGYGASQVWSVARLRTQWPDTTSFMRYRMAAAREEGTPFRLRWTPVPMARISGHLKQCVLVGEDDRFYQHNGFDLHEMRNAMEEAEAGERPHRGASTITQQLAKNLYLSPDRTLTRKVREAAYTVLLELFLSKDRILELYLNSVEWGDGIFGAEAGSKAWFGKGASGLSLEESARMAACLPMPLRVHPNGSSRFVLHRKASILERLRRYRGIGSDPVLEPVAVPEKKIEAETPATKPDTADSAQSQKKD